jgi:putative acyl-CoA dehydrogenase
MLRAKCWRTETPMPLSLDRAPARGATHEVFNQTPALVDYNLFTSDPALGEALGREGAGWAAAELGRIGGELGRAATFENGHLANRHTPQLHTHDARGVRVDRIEFHPAWHELMRGIIANGFHAAPWAEPRAGAHVARAAGYLMQAQVESGTLCPTTMTYGSIAAMRRDPTLRADWVPTLLSRRYDPRDIPLAGKTGGLIGMGMTEKQGGSDVRANTTNAVREQDGSYRITGHKWFFSAPQCDAHLVLAQSEAGLSCFFVPRFAPDGTKNTVQIQRLKDKLGNRSNASSEVEFHGAYARLLGDEGRGVPTILEMGTYTRLDCVIGTAGLMRQAVAQALHHARHRKAFGRLLIDQPLMKQVLCDLVIESEAATLLALRLARAFDAEDDVYESAVRRVLTSAGKFWVCKRGPQLAAEAMEVLGGNGYVEEGIAARIYREMPLNSIWEGSGNVMCLDVLRAFSRSPETRDAIRAELLDARGHHADFDSAFAELDAWIATPAIDEGHARRITERIATLIQAALLLRSSRGAVADAFCKTRLAHQGGGVFGSLPPAIDSAAILAGAFSA